MGTLPTGVSTASQTFTLTFDPVRAVLTGVVVLVALGVGPWLARRAGRVPERVEPLFWHPKNKKGQVSRREQRVVESEGELSPWISRITLFSVWIAALVAIAYIWLGSQLFSAENVDKTILPGLRTFGFQFGGSLLVIALSLSIGRLLQRSFVASLAGAHLSSNLVVLGRRTIYVATLIVGAVVVLAIWGAGVVVPVAVFGALTVALSLALQDILKNLVAGIYLLIEHPFAIGQVITSDSGGKSYTGTVEDIRLRVTVLRLETGERVLIPNASIFGAPVTNRSVNRERRMGLKLSLPDPGPRQVRETQAKVLAAVRSMPEVLSTPAPEVWVTGASEGKLELDATFWLMSTRDDQEATVLAGVVERVRGALGTAEITELIGAQ